MATNFKDVLRSSVTVHFAVFAFTICVILSLPNIAMSKAVYYGQLNSFKIDQFYDEPINNEDAQYFAKGSTLIINPKSNSPITFAGIEYNVIPAKDTWRFFLDGRSFVKTSESLFIHNHKISFPNCTNGNICPKDDNFTIKLNEVKPEDAYNAHIFLNNQDVTTMFFYDESDNTFKLKEYHSKKLYDLLISEDAYISWKYDINRELYNGYTRVHFVSSTIEGSVRDTDGEIPTYLIGKEVKLVHKGNDAITPHIVTTTIKPDGRYSVSNLAYFDYEIFLDDQRINNTTVVDIIYSDTQDKVKDEVTVVLLHETAVVADKIEVKDTYRAGEFVAINIGETWKLSGKITSIKQLSGDAIIHSFIDNTILLIMPVSKVSKDKLLLELRVGNKVYYVEFIHPIIYSNSHSQFKPFDPEGMYAYTEINGLNADGVVAFKGGKMPEVFIGSPVYISKDTVKAHYYNDVGRAIDVTYQFNWDDSEQKLVGRPKLYGSFYNSMQNSEGTLAFTFCDSKEEYCFRNKHTIRPGGADINVTVNHAGASGYYKDKYLLLREVNVLDAPVARLIKLGIVNLFEDIPVGYYEITLVDMKLKHYGRGYVEVTKGNNLRHQTLDFTIKPQNIPPDYTTYLLNELYSGNVVDLIAEPIKLYQNDFTMVDLDDYFPYGDLDIVDMQILGQLPGEVILYQDNNISILTEDMYKSSTATIVIHTKDKKYLLPVSYRGDNYVVVTEKGRDYSMCPEERPYCVNAFVEVTGVKQGIYNGQTPLRLMLPIDFAENEVKVYMESVVDVTEMFTVSSKRRSVTLKNEYIPNFLSMIYSNSEPISVRLKDREYNISLIPGYKTIDTTLVDQSGAKMSALTDILAKISCQYADDRYFTQIARVVDGSSVKFEDVPECTYRLSLVDKDRLYKGSLEAVTVPVGENKISAVLPIICMGDSDQFINDCKPFLPLLDSNLLIAPDFALLLLDSSGSNVVNSSKYIDIRKLGRGVLIHAPATDTKALGIKKDSLIINDKKVEIRLSNIVSELTSSSDMEEISIAKVEGVDASLIYDGAEPLVVRFESNRTYQQREVSVKLIEDSGTVDLSYMFVWYMNTQSAVLRNVEKDNFIKVLSGKQKKLQFNFGDYTTSVVIGVGSADVHINIDKDSFINSESGRAILIGKNINNGYHYRREIGLSDTIIFKNVPEGFYDVVVFDQKRAIYGSKKFYVSQSSLKGSSDMEDLPNIMELSGKSELQIEVPVKKIN